MGFAQVVIGPGTAIFTRYARVLEADGSPMPVRAALVEINRTLDETLARQEGGLDPDWNPATDRRITDRESAQHLTRSLIAARGGRVAEVARVPEQTGLGFPEGDASWRYIRVPPDGFYQPCTRC